MIQDTTFFKRFGRHETSILLPWMDGTKKGEMRACLLLRDGRWYGTMCGCMPSFSVSCFFVATTLLICGSSFFLPHSSHPLFSLFSFNMHYKGARVRLGFSFPLFLPVATRLFVALCLCVLYGVRVFSTVILFLHGVPLLGYVWLRRGGLHSRVGFLTLLSLLFSGCALDWWCWC